MRGAFAFTYRYRYGMPYPSRTALCRNPEAHAYPLLHAFAQRMHGHPKMAAYLASPMHKLPVNNPGAGFGAGADYSKLHARAAP